MSKFRIILIDLSSGEEEWIDEEWYDSLDEAEEAKNEMHSNLSTGYDIMNLMGDVDESEKFDPDDAAYRIEEVDEDGEVIDTYEYYY